MKERLYKKSWENKWVFTTSTAVYNPFKQAVIALWGKRYLSGEKRIER